MARQSKAAIKAAKETIVASALEDIEFVYGEVTELHEWHRETRHRLEPDA